MSGASADERKLLDRCRRGEELAWRELYREHAQRVGRYLRYLLGPVLDVDDLVQTVFIEMTRGLRDFREDSEFSTWLFSVVRHVAEVHARTEYRRDRRRNAFAEWAVLGRTFAPDPATNADDRAVVRFVCDVLEGMDQRKRVVWLMSEIEGLRCDEIATAIDVAPGTARSRLFNARAEIFEAMNKVTTPKPSSWPWRVVGRSDGSE